MKKNSFYGSWIKRPLDLLAAFLILIPSLPVMMVVAFLLWISGHRPFIFTQRRVGWGDKTFRLFKFRTMTNETDAEGQLLPDQSRMTRLGGFIRKTSLDELPQLFNVFKGDMSLIGPRPLIIDYLPLYDTEQKKRHWVRPGISGWAQVNGRNAVSWEEKFALDIWYVKNQSFLLDLKILLLTVKKVLLMKDISQEGHVTIEPFKGNSTSL